MGASVSSSSVEPDDLLRIESGPQCYQISVAGSFISMEKERSRLNDSEAIGLGPGGKKLSWQGTGGAGGGLASLSNEGEIWSAAPR